MPANLMKKDIRTYSSKNPIVKVAEEPNVEEQFDQLFQSSTQSPVFSPSFNVSDTLDSSKLDGHQSLKAVADVSLLSVTNFLRVLDPNISSSSSNSKNEFAQKKISRLPLTEKNQLISYKLSSDSSESNRKKRQRKKKRERKKNESLSTSYVDSNISISYSEVEKDKAQGINDKKNKKNIRRSRKKKEYIENKPPLLTKNFDSNCSSSNIELTNEEKQGNNNNKKNGKSRKKKENIESEALISSSDVSSNCLSSLSVIQEEKQRSNDGRNKIRNGKSRRKNEPSLSTSNLSPNPRICITPSITNITQRRKKFVNLHPFKDSSCALANFDSNESYSESSSSSRTGNIFIDEQNTKLKKKVSLAGRHKYSSISASANSGEGNPQQKNQISDAADTSEMSSKVSNSNSYSFSSYKDISIVSSGCSIPAESLLLDKLEKGKNLRDSSPGASYSSHSISESEFAAKNKRAYSTSCKTQTLCVPASPNSRNKSYSSNAYTSPALSLDTDSINDITDSMLHLKIDPSEIMRKFSFNHAVSTPNKSDDSSSSSQPIVSPVGISPVLSSDEVKIESSSFPLNVSSENATIDSKPIYDAKKIQAVDSPLSVLSTTGSRSSSSSETNHSHLNNSAELSAVDFVEASDTSREIESFSGESWKLSPKTSKMTNGIKILRRKSVKSSQDRSESVAQQTATKLGKLTSTNNCDECKTMSVTSIQHIKHRLPPICDESLFVNPQDVSKFKEPFCSQGTTDSVFKMPSVPFIKPTKMLPKKEVDFFISTIHEDSILESFSNPRFSTEAHSKLSIANKNDTFFGNRMSLNFSMNCCLDGRSRLVLEPGKNWRRSLLRAKRENLFLEATRIHDVTGIDKTKVLEETIGTFIGKEGVLTLDKLLLDVSAKEFTFLRCCQSEPIPFSELLPDESLDNCAKLGEGVFGEVFHLGSSQDGSVIKIIPIEGDKIVNQEKQKKFEEVLSEIITAQELSNLRNGSRNATSSFNEVLDCKCVFGQYPVPLINQWNVYNVKKRSYNDCPIMFEHDQLYIVLKLANGGQDLESFVFTSAYQSYSAFLQIGLTLAIGEASLQFEHRDLHWGNILLAPTKDKKITFRLNDVEYDIPSHGIKVTIIDFTLSRVTFNAKKKSCVVAFDMGQDPGLFQSEGDYQFDMYRMMKEEVQDDWCSFHPRSNIFWLHYVADKMLTLCHYKNSKGAAHKKYSQYLNEFFANLLNCSSSQEFIESFPTIYGREVCD